MSQKAITILEAPPDYQDWAKQIERSISHIDLTEANGLLIGICFNEQQMEGCKSTGVLPVAVGHFKIGSPWADSKNYVDARNMAAHNIFDICSYLLRNKEYSQKLINKLNK